MSENEELSLTIIDKSIDVFKSGSAILKTHKQTAAKAMLYADTLLKEWEAANAIDDPDKKAKALAEVDDKTNKFLVRCREKNGERKEERKAISQLMTSISGLFIEQEALLDVGKSDKLIKNQNFRDNYVKWRKVEDDRKKKIADDKANKAKEEADIRAYLTNKVAQFLLNILATKKSAMSNAFNSITLVDYDMKSDALKKMGTAFDEAKLDKLVLDNPPFKYHVFADIEVIKIGIKTGYDYDAFNVQYSKDIAAYKRELVDKLPSKKEELDEAERLRLKAIEDEKERQKKLDEAKTKAAKERAEKDAQAAREKEAAAKQKIEDDKLLREEQERQRLRDEAEKNKQAAEQKIELEKAGSKANTLFEQIIEATPERPAPSSKKSFVITVKHQTGWAQLFHIFFERKGVTMPLADWDKLTMKQIKTFIEKLATKETEMIESAFIEYTEEIKARNVKEKVE